MQALEIDCPKISEVSSLSKEEVATLVETGFIKLLSVDTTPETLAAWQDHIFTVTMGFAQPVQEYCEQLGYIVEDSNWKGSVEQLSNADAAWLKQGLSQASGTIAQLMNERETKAGRRNQVLYSLGRINKRVFHVAEVEEVLRQHFSQSAAGKTLAVGQILGELTSGEQAIIKRSTKGSTFEFKDARFAMAVRVLLQKDALKEKVTKVD
jgi:hypothetical protein